MPKNTGTAGHGRPDLGGTKTEPPKKEQPPTYAELNINKKDASKWQNMAENKEVISKKIEECTEQKKPIKENECKNDSRARKIFNATKKR